METISTASAYLGAASCIAVLLWVVILVVLHFIKPDLKPAATLVSEYAMKPRGWIMQGAFYCMAIACIAFVVAAWPYLSPLGLILLAIIGVGFIGTGMFVTDPAFIGEGGQSKQGKLHVFFAFLIIFLFPVTVTIIDINLSTSFIWSSLGPWSLALSLFTWSGFIVFIITSGLRVNNKAPVGYAERFLIFTFSVWLLAVSIPLVYF